MNIEHEAIKVYFNTNTKTHKNICFQYLGQYPYKVKGVGVGSLACQTCYRFKGIGKDEKNYILCEKK